MNTSVWDLNIAQLVNEAKAELKKIQEKSYFIGGEKVSVTTPEMEKVIIRHYLDSKMSKGEAVTGKQLVTNAWQSKQRREHVINYVKEEYGIVIKPEEVEVLIEAQVKEIEKSDRELLFFEELSTALGMTTSEFFYDWEYENIAMQVVGKKVLPMLKEKNSQKSEETSLAYQQRMLDLFYKNLDETIK